MQIKKAFGGNYIVERPERCEIWNDWRVKAVTPSPCTFTKQIVSALAWHDFVVIQRGTIRNGGKHSLLFQLQLYLFCFKRITMQTINILWIVASAFPMHRRIVLTRLLKCVGFCSEAYDALAVVFFVAVRIVVAFA